MNTRMSLLGITAFALTLNSTLPAFAETASPALDRVSTAISQDATEQNRQTLFEAIDALEQVDAANANLIMGTIYEQGRWVPADDARARTHFKAALDAGSWLGQVHYARLLSGPDASADEQDEAYQLAQAAKDIIGSQLNSGEISFQEWDQLSLVINPVIGPMALDRAVERAEHGDWDGAFPHYFIASEAGIQHASMALGYMYRQGLGMRVPNLEWSEAQFLGASYCSTQNMEHYGYSQGICDQAEYELNTTRLLITEREQEEQAQAYAVMGLIGLGVLGLGVAASGGSGYQPPNVDENIGLQAAGALMWLGKW